MVAVAEFFRVLHALRSVLIVVALACLFLSVPQQTWEIYRSLAQDIAIYGQSIWSNDSGVNWVSIDRAAREVTFALIGLGLLCAVLFRISTQLTRPIVLHGQFVRQMKRLMPATFPLLIFMALALGLYCSVTQAPNADAKRILIPEINYYFGLDLPPGRARDAAAQPILDALFSFNAILRVAFWSALGIGFLIAAMCLYVSFRRNESRPSVQNVLFLALTIGAIGIFVFAPAKVSILLGPLAIFSIFTACASVILALIANYSDRHGVPYLALLLLFGIGLSAFDLNDNHDLRRSTQRNKSVDPRQVPDLEDALTRWYAARRDREKYESRSEPYPLYIVAAQGGEIYAAFHAASWLASVQDRCPAFASHLFAVSGVSGGSLGAVIFSSLLNPSGHGSECIDVGSMPSRRGLGTLADQADDLLSQDLLSPLLSGFLFSDTLQRFLPQPLVFTQLDRALKFEEGIEHAAQEIALKTSDHSGSRANAQFREFLNTPYALHWDPKANRPALLFNTTEVGTGKRRVFSPFTFANSESSLSFFNAGCKAHDEALTRVSVLAAAVASARFPWVTPPASLASCDADGRERKVQLVDGAYFENSGVATARDLMRSIDQVVASGPLRGKVRVHLIALTGGNYPHSRYTGLSEATAPVLALLNARTARGYITLSEAERMGQDRSVTSQDTVFSKVTLSDYGYELPLGWRLSAMSMLLIRAQNGTYVECPDLKRTNENTLPTSPCLLARIARELSGEPSSVR